MANNQSTNKPSTLDKIGAGATAVGAGVAIIKALGTIFK